MIIPQSELDELKALMAKATGGEWERMPDSTNLVDITSGNAGTIYGGGWHIALMFADSNELAHSAEANAEFIAACHNIMPRLIEDLEAARKEK